MDSNANHRIAGLPVLDRMHALHVPAVSIAIIEDGRIVEETALGIRCADGAPEDRVTPRTRFQACSISKPIAALAMQRLVAQGVLDLDADINTLLRGWQVPASGDWQPRITLRQLASHSAGLSTHGFPGYSRDATLPDLVHVLSGSAPANTESVRVAIVPGVQFRYSGGGLVVMQLIMQEATGVPFPQLMRDLVLDPVQMQDSGYDQPLPDTLHRTAAVAHDLDGRPIPGDWHVYPELAAAGLWTTAGDLARYAIAVQRAVADADGALLSPADADRMLTPQTPSAPRAERVGGLNAVGIGPFVRLADGRVSYFGHSGGNEGFRCHLLAHRDLGFGAAVMTNGDGGMPLIAEILDAIAEARRWPDFVRSELDPLPPQGSGLDPFTGSYRLESGVMINLERRGSTLLASIGDQQQLTFLALDAETVASRMTDTTLTRSPEGLLLRQGDSEFVCHRVDG